ncbi:MAG: ATP-binding cassette domain-containing protein [Bdellovibrionaceae bacterium]|nr:ATP-binding cassette domain-containing protein [Bdellovibrio sp.]
MFLQKLFFSQAQSLIALGRRRVLQAGDRFQLPPEINPEACPWDDNAIDWSNRKSFFWTLRKVSRRTVRRAAAVQLIASTFSFATPFLIHTFITRLQLGNFSSQDLFELSLIAISFGICGVGSGIAIQHYFFHTLQFNQIAVNLVNKKIFSHALKLSNNAKNKFQVGDIVNYMSSDTDAIANVSISVIDLLNAALLLTGCTITLFIYLGWSAAVALLVMALLIPVTHRLSKSFLRLGDRMMAFRDKRITLMTQVMNAIRVVKYFVWEQSVLDEVNEVRRKEIQARYELSRSEIMWHLIYVSISSLVLFSALLTHVLRGQTVDLALIFTCIAIFSIMEDHFGGLSRFISQLINAFVSADRIIAFLKSETVSRYEAKINQVEFLKLENISFQFSDSQKIFNNLNLAVRPGESIAIVGSVGSGKSTLLNILLSELKPQMGSVLYSTALKAKAYVPQDAYIINSTLRENLVFGKKNVTEAQINRALQLSALNYDLVSWPAGLNTEIGEKGVNLSGGQKQRVSLARAILADADLILLDDPLSAVDPNTERWLTDELLFGEWKEKTRVMVTHRLASLNRFDQILFLENGTYCVGTYDELLTCSPSFKSFLRTHDENTLKEKNSVHQLAAHTERTSGGGDTTRITEDEDRVFGAVDKTVYIDYMKALGGSPKRRKLILAILFLGAICVAGTPLLQKLWLSQSSKMTNLTPLFIIQFYGALGLLTVLLTFLSSRFWAHRGISAGQTFHDQMLRSVLAAPIRFFDSTPVGRILQRFSRDMESVDIHLQWTFDHTIHAFFHVTISFLLIVFVIPPVLIFMIPIFFVYHRLQKDYRQAAREMKRLDSSARSPRYAHFKETLNGLAVIRAFQQAPWAMDQFYSKLRYAAEMFRTAYIINRWFSVRLPLIGAGISTVTGLMIVFASHYGYIGAGTAGLVTIYAIDFWRHLNWGVRVFSDLETQMTSVERLKYYSNITAELDVIGPAAAIEKSWPETGELEFKNVWLRYAPHLPMVLKDVSFKITSGQRIGLVGRTGSGKSTIFQSVYRFVDIERGEILLNHTPIHQVPLERLRRNLAVIPQDPTLFMGTLRSNIDRYNEADDDDIWQVLNKVSLESFVRLLPNQLHFKVVENGANLSQGQRQLICMARALLTKVKIIFLDEATASVDVETDAIVQKVIRESLAGMTLVTIAHRLSTLEGYDRVIELRDGEIVTSL